MLTMATNFRPSTTEAVDQGKILKFSCVRDVRCYSINVKNNMSKEVVEITTNTETCSMSFEIPLDVAS